MKLGVAAQLLGAVLLWAGLTTSAAARWSIAESDRFVVYTESRPQDAADLAEMLERFHSAMEQETGVKVAIPSPSSRVTVYVVGSDRELKELYGNRNSAVAGFYVPRASGSAAFVQTVRIKSGEPDFALTVLLHEYAHHFLISTSRHAMPRWLSEGAAEYFASAKFHPDGRVDIGLPNNDRAWEIAQASPVSVEELLDHELYAARKSNSYSAFYGRSWLLYHFLRFDESRAGQLGRYRLAVANGMGSLDAAKQVFGDLDTLEKELQSYGKRRRMSGMRFAESEISVGTVTSRTLGEGHDAMMPVIIRSKRGVDEESAPEVLSLARQVAARFPDDAQVQAALAEAEFDAGNHAEAIAAADSAIAKDPMVKNAYIQKGLALFAQAGEADDAAAAYAQAMKPFSALNALENDHPLPLIYYYRSFVMRGAAPPEGARAALERAAVLTPFDHSLAIDAGIMLAAEGKLSLAGYLLKPVAANPHGGPRAAYADALLTAMTDRPDGSPFDASTIVPPVVVDVEDADGD